MSSEKARAIVLRVIDFSESSSVVALFTREFGQIRALAKGARRPKGPFESALDLLSICRVVFLRKSSDALDLLTEAKLERRFRGFGHDLSRLYAGYYVAELLSELTEVYDAHPALYDAAEQVLDDLCQSGPIAPLVFRFELVALTLLGHMPSLEICVECGRKVAAVGRVPFGQTSGGVLCAACRPGKREVVSVSAGALRTLATLSKIDSSAWRRLDLDRRMRGELRGILNRYLENLLGRRPRMHEFFGLLSGD